MEPSGPARPSAGPGSPSGAELHPIVRAAGEEGRLPDWARCSERRRAHADRVADLMDGWAAGLDLGERDRVRWRAAALLHDALRGAEPRELIHWTERDWPGLLLHGPACAARLREEGVEDEELLEAIEYHTLGHPELRRIGRYLYLADFLDPGRQFLEEVRERLRALLPDDPNEALLSVAALRLAHRLEVRGRIHPLTVEFWNRLLEEAEPGDDAEGGSPEGSEDGAPTGGRA